MSQVCISQDSYLDFFLICWSLNPGPHAHYSHSFPNKLQPHIFICSYKHHSSDGKVSWQSEAEEYHKVTVSITAYSSAPKERVPQCKCNNSSQAEEGFPSEEVVTPLLLRMLQLCSILLCSGKAFQLYSGRCYGSTLLQRNLLQALEKMSHHTTNLIQEIYLKGRWLPWVRNSSKPN